MNPNQKISSCLLTLILLFSISCKKDKNTSTTPEIITTPVTEILASSATSGGTINHDGGEGISFSGLCFSKTNTTPTINDDTTKLAISSGSFVAVMKNLSPSETYYVRAYATNRNGTGYGNVVSFKTGNAAPVANTVGIIGIVQSNEILTGNYSYTDAESDIELGTSYQWYIANDGAGAGEVAIPGATMKTYHITDAQQGKYIRFGVTPKAATGTANGIEVKSTFVGAVGEATTVTFTYSGAEVTYGIINGPSGKKWLDRNLGATRIAQSANDWQAFGDMFQWGRLADGHQRITRTGATPADAVGVTGTVATRSTGNVPPTNQFIIYTGIRGDWRNPQESNLWQGVNGINNPCPAGWKVPTLAEWNAEGIGSMSDAYTKLKLTYSGFRSIVDAAFNSNDAGGYYWTSTVDETGAIFYSYWVGFESDRYYSASRNRGQAVPCRCIKQ